MAKTRTRDNADFEIFSAYIVEAGLDPEIRATCLKHRVTLRDIFLDVRGASVHAARLEVWWNLLAFGKSSSEIGRIFARDATSVMHAMKRLAEQAAKNNIALTPETAGDVARSLALDNRKVWTKMGENVAALNEKKSL